MSTNFFDRPLSEFVIHASALAEGGYNYYLYIHPRGQGLVMREKTDSTEYKYANAGINGVNWAGRAGLSYVNYNSLR